MARVAIDKAADFEWQDFYTTYPTLGSAANALKAAVYSEANPLPKEVREAVRMRIALINDCLVCRGARMMPQLGEAFYQNIENFRARPDLYSEAQRVAMEFAELYALDHLSIGAAMFRRLREHFDEDQIAALTISTGSFLSMGRLTRVLMLEHACPIEEVA